MAKQERTNNDYLTKYMIYLPKYDNFFTKQKNGLDIQAEIKKVDIESNLKFIAPYEAQYFYYLNNVNNPLIYDRDFTGVYNHLKK